MTQHSLISFFFSSYGDPRDLHSFPTRRSSDLNGPGQTGFQGSAFGSQGTNIASGNSKLWTFTTDKPLSFGSFGVLDRKSTRLNSSHGYISYAVFCLKKKKYN